MKNVTSSELNWNSVKDESNEKLKYYQLYHVTNPLSRIRKIFALIFSCIIYDTWSKPIWIHNIQNELINDTIFCTKICLCYAYQISVEHILFCKFFCRDSKTTKILLTAGPVQTFVLLFIFNIYHRLQKYNFKLNFTR